MMKKTVAWIAALLLTIAPAAAQTIDSLGAAGALAGTESVPIFQSANPAVRTTTGAIGNSAALTGDCVKSAGSSTTTCNNPPPIYISGNWYIAGGEMLSTGASNANANNGTVSCYPFFFRAAATINALGAFVNTLSVGSNYSLALYANNPATNRPTGTALGSSGNLSTTSAAAVSSGAISIVVAGPRWLWACANSDNATPTLRGGTFFSMSGFMGTATQANLDAGSAKLSGVTTPLTFASGWTDLTGATWTEINSRTWPLVQFKIN